MMQKKKKKKKRCDEIEELKGGAWLYNYGKTEDNPEAKGVGFLIHPKFKDYVEDIKHH